VFVSIVFLIRRDCVANDNLVENFERNLHRLREFIDKFVQESFSGSSPNIY
jgi:hypothetical protein